MFFRKKFRLLTLACAVIGGLLSGGGTPPASAEEINAIATVQCPNSNHTYCTATIDHCPEKSEYEGKILYINKLMNNKQKNIFIKNIEGKPLDPTKAVISTQKKKHLVKQTQTEEEYNQAVGIKDNVKEEGASSENTLQKSEDVSVYQDQKSQIEETSSEGKKNESVKLEEFSAHDKSTPKYIVLAKVVNDKVEGVACKVQKVLVWNRKDLTAMRKGDALHYEFGAQYEKNTRARLKTAALNAFPSTGHLVITNVAGKKGAIRNKRFHAFIGKYVELVIGEDKQVLHLEEISTARMLKRKASPVFGDNRPAVHENHVEVADALWNGVGLKTWGSYREQILATENNIAERRQARKNKITAVGSKIKGVATSARDKVKSLFSRKKPD